MYAFSDALNSDDAPMPQSISPYQLGILVRMKNGERILVTGSYLGSHGDLFQQAKEFKEFGSVAEILWGGELLFEGNRILEANDTSGGIHALLTGKFSELFNRKQHPDIRIQNDLRHLEEFLRSESSALLHPMFQPHTFNSDRFHIDEKLNALVKEKNINLRHELRVVMNVITLATDEAIEAEKAQALESIKPHEIEILEWFLNSLLVSFPRNPEILSTRKLIRELRDKKSLPIQKAKRLTELIGDVSKLWEREMAPMRVFVLEPEPVDVATARRSRNWSREQ